MVGKVRAVPVQFLVVRRRIIHSYSLSPSTRHHFMYLTGGSLVYMICKH